MLRICCVYAALSILLYHPLNPTKGTHVQHKNIAATAGPFDLIRDLDVQHSTCHKRDLSRTIPQHEIRSTTDDPPGSDLKRCRPSERQGTNCQLMRICQISHVDGWVSDLWGLEAPVDGITKPVSEITKPVSEMHG